MSRHQLQRKVRSAMAVLLEVMRDQEKKSPELAAKQARLLKILKARQVRS